MFFGFDLKSLIRFPVQDVESRRHFLVGCLVSLLAMIVPILPYFLLIGYAARISRQIFRNESPRMIPWDDWQNLFVDGARMFGARFIYTLPILILILPLFLSIFILPFAMVFLTESSDEAAAAMISLLYFLAIFGLLVIVAPISIVASIIVPAAEMHTAANKEFAAAFKVREWWSIFRANFGGFLAAFAVYLMAAFATSFIFQVVMATLILSCLLPILLPAMTMYLVLIMYAASAQAYREGAARLSMQGTSPDPIPT